MKLLYIPSLNLPVIHWRIESYAQAMVKIAPKDVIHVEYMVDISQDPNLRMSWEDALFGYGELSDTTQAKFNAAFKHFDAIILQKLQTKKGVAMLSALQKKYPKVKVIAEIDDNVGDVPPSNQHNWSDQHTWAAEHVMRSDAVIVSTEYLKKSLYDCIIGEGKPVYVAPNCINKELWKIKENRKSYKDTRIGYVGGGGHDEDLIIAYEAILPLLKPGVKFVIRYGAFRPDWLKPHPQIDFKPCNWHISVYPQKIYDLKLDMALAPLRDTTFNRCKSNIKWLEMAYMGIDVVASDVEPYRAEIGSICLSENDPDIFREAIKEVMTMKRKPQRLKEKCIDNYNIMREAKGVLTFVKSLL